MASWTLLKEKTLEKRIRIQVMNISSRFYDFKNNFQIILKLFSLIFMQQLDEPFRDKEIFNNLS